MEHQQYIHRITTSRLALATLCLGVAAVLVASPALADEGGVPFWMSGSNSSLSAVPVTPGWSLPTVAYYYSGNAAKSKESCLAAVYRLACPRGQLRSDANVVTKGKLGCPVVGAGSSSRQTQCQVSVGEVVEANQ